MFNLRKLTKKEQSVISDGDALKFFFRFDPTSISEFRNLLMTNQSSLHLNIIIIIIIIYAVDVVIVGLICKVA